MRLLQLCREPRLYSCQRLKQAAENAGFSMDILDPNRFLLKIDSGRLIAYYQPNTHEKQSRALHQIADYAGVIGRFGPTSTTQGCRVLHHFEQQHIACLNNANAFTLARDKWQSLQCLAASHIAVPDSAIGGDDIAGGDLSIQFPTAQVIKTLSGSQGVGVMLAETETSAKSLLETFIQHKIPVFNQMFIQESQGRDIRAFVIGDDVVAAMERIGRPNDFRANIHQGGTAKPIQLSQQEKAIAVKAAKAIGLDVAGVDLLHSSQGLMVLEVNASPGLEMIEKISGIDIASEMIAYLRIKISASK